MLAFTAARGWLKVSTCLRAAPGYMSSSSTKPRKCQQNPNSTQITSHRLAFYSLIGSVLYTQNYGNKCTCYTVLHFSVQAMSGNDFVATVKPSFHCSCGVTYFIFTDKWGDTSWEKACQSSASYLGSVVYVGEQGGVWRGESLGGVCYRGTEPNSWLILELLERKSRGLTFPAVFVPPENCSGTTGLQGNATCF